MTAKTMLFNHNTTNIILPGCNANIKAILSGNKGFTAQNRTAILTIQNTNRSTQTAVSKVVKIFNLVKWIEVKP